MTKQNPAMVTLNSSCIRRVEYDYDSGNLEITFNSGKTYTLRGVPDYHYYGLINSSSPGWYFNYYLKGRY